MDGHVRLEVTPYLALYTDETVAEARRLWKAVGRDNLMVKVPGTDKGVAAIRTLIGDGLNINVTLLFGQTAYEAVAEAFIAGLEDRVARGESVVLTPRPMDWSGFFASGLKVSADFMVGMEPMPVQERFF